MLSRVEQLRQEMREKFPDAHRLAHNAQRSFPLRQNSQFSLDSLPQGKISELTPERPSAGLSLVVASLLQQPRLYTHPDIVLIDGADSFDPGSFSSSACSRLLWVRCASAMEMVRAADLLAQDGNMPTLLFDATGLLRRDIQAIPAAAWWRLSQTIGRTTNRLIAISLFPIVPCAAARISLSADLNLSHFTDSRAHLITQLRTSAKLLRRAT